MQFFYPLLSTFAKHFISKTTPIVILKGDELHCRKALINEGKYLLSASAFLGGGHEHRGQLLPPLRKGTAVGFDVAVCIALALLIGLCEDNAKGYALSAQELHKVEVYFERFVAAVDQHKEKVESLSLSDVVGNDGGKLAPYGLRGAGVAIARQVHQPPLLIDQKVVDEFSLAGGCRHLCDLALREHIDERRLTHIGATDEGKFWLAMVGNLR